MDWTAELEMSRATVRASLLQYGVTVRISVVFNHRMRTTMGRVVYECGTARIELNPNLYARASSTKRRNTDKHEAAHVVVWWQNGQKRSKSQHGHAWQRVMRSLGETPERCHREDTSGLKVCQRRWRLTCSRCGSALGVVSTRRKNSLAGAERIRVECCGSMSPREVQVVQVRAV